MDSVGISIIGGIETAVYLLFNFFVEKGLPSYLAYGIEAVAQILLTGILLMMIIEAVAELFELCVVKYVHAEKIWKKHLVGENFKETKNMK